LFLFKKLENNFLSTNISAVILVLAAPLQAKKAFVGRRYSSYSVLDLSTRWG
jgi:hypothetical protein